MRTEWKIYDSYLGGEARRTNRMNYCVGSLQEKHQTRLFGDGGAIPTSTHQLIFKKIRRTSALRFLIENHYLHRSAPVSFSFGAFFDGFLVGALTIGKPASHTLIEGVAGKENAVRVFELNRLYLFDFIPKNSESRFIAWVCKQLPKEIILVSYADSAFGHIGCVYQANGWKYTGTSTPFIDWTMNGKDHRSIPKHKRSDHSKLYSIERSKKFRYVKFLNKDYSQLKYKILPYPKRKDLFIMGRTNDFNVA